MKKQSNSLNEALLLTPKQFTPSFPDWKISGVLNPGGIRLPNKKILLLVRVMEEPLNPDKKNTMKCPMIVSEKEYLTKTSIRKRSAIKTSSGTQVYFNGGECLLSHISHFRRVILDQSGFNVENIEDKPYFVGLPKDSNYGVEDPRITKIGKKYYMTYVTVSSENGVSTSLAVSKDLKKWSRKGIIFREQNKDVVLFPEKIKGKYAALNRPESGFVFSKSSIWISYSPDLIHWGKGKKLVKTRKNSWESERNGAGPPPIKTKKGWLIIYHGVAKVKNKQVYSAGAALLDLKNPEKILARTPLKKPLIIPSKKYETDGFVNNVVFPTVAIPTFDRASLLIYSGGADSVTTLRKISFKDIFKNMKKI